MVLEELDIEHVGAGFKRNRTEQVLVRKGQTMYTGILILDLIEHHKMYCALQPPVTILYTQSWLSNKGATVR